MKKTRVIKLVSIIILVLIIGFGLSKMKSGLTKKSTTNAEYKHALNNDIKKDYAYQYSYVPHANEGTATALISEDNKKILQQSNFKIQNKDDFISKIGVSNLSDKEQEFILLPIIDYKQQSIQIGKDNLDKYKFSLKPKEIIFIPFTVKNLKEGIHDIIFLLAKDPNNTNLDPNYRKATELSHIISKRMSVTVGKNKEINIPYTNIPDTETNDKLSGSIVTPTKELKPWITEEHVSHDMKYYINVGNISKNEQDFAVIALLNWNQVSIKDNQKVIMSKIDSNTLVHIEGELKSQDIKSGVSNFTTLYIPSPYKEVKNELDMYVEPSINVGLQKD